MNDALTIREVAWPQARERLLAIRFRVFVDEQGVPAELEEDGHDPQARHILVSDGAGHDLATGRLRENGHIGRMAVVAGQRGHGLGSQVLRRLLQLARDNGLSHVHLNAQCSACGFYQRFGFQPQGAIFDDAGIPHQRMSLDLSR